jgi:hypothetical protein
MKKKARRRKPIKVNQFTPIISKAVIAELRSFIEDHPPKRFSRNLRSMLLEFLIYDGATEANYLKDLLYDLEGLFMLLEVILAEQEHSYEKGTS